ncbi:DUF1116 domain-containing protein [Melaminivora alkalimesophila]|uniref:DUF1116 domain-containing protein n=1 Tax=Melaminivora alkalimesophila TaxID=1165852 RepID=UPI0002E827D6|nr:DUF1116 domain-containing protein [Melaminivora alkalimesophila]
MTAAPLFELLHQELKIVNIGVPSFSETLTAVNAPHVHVHWHPPAGGNVAAVQTLESLERHAEILRAANERAVAKILAARPVVVDVQPARDVVPGMNDRILLHAGPPVTWEKMCGPVRGAVIGAIIFEGWAETVEEAEALAASGAVKLEPNHHHSAVGPMAGLTSPSMQVFVVENQEAGNRAYVNMNEGLGKVLRFGANSPEVLERLAWMRDVLGPALGAAIRHVGGLDVKSLIARALQMGDECHNRNAAGTSLLVRSLFSALVEVVPVQQLTEVADFLGRNDHFFLNLSMAACKVTMDAARNIEGSSVVTAMARNGTEFGIQLSGTGDQWFTAPSPVIDALFFPGYGPDDAAPDLGDSCITETMGIGGFAMAAAPAIVQFVGGNAGDALNFTKEMRNITLAEEKTFGIPALDFAGTPTGIDAMLVVDTGIQPVINTGVAHREPGVGQVGAGISRAPMECFIKALKALDERLAASAR